MPAALAVAGAIALVELGSTLVRSWVLAVLGVLYGIGVLTGPRIPGRRWLIWGWRAAVTAAAVLAPSTGLAYGADTFISARTASILGTIAAGELVLLAWLRSEEPAWTRLFLTASCIFLCGTHTIEADATRILAPAFVVALLFALRPAQGPLFRPSSRAGRGEVVRQWAVRCGYAGGALLAGYTLFLPLWIWRQDITIWTNELLFGRQQQAGFSSLPSLDPSFGIRDSLTRVARIDLRSLPRRKAPGPGLDFEHLRAAAFSTYSRGRWGPAVHRRAFVAADALAEAPPGAYPVRLERYEGTGWVLPSLLETRAVTLEGGAPLLWDGSGGGTLRTRDREPTAAVLSVDPSGNRVGPLSTTLSPEGRWRYLAIRRDVDPGVDELANSIQLAALREARPGVPREQVLIDAVVRHLQRNHQYSQTIRIGAGDPVSNFLLLRKSGHCEFFASGAAILLRLMGVPTRYVSGFYVHELAEPGVLVARQRDAHAWAEAWVEGRGWVSVEATPPAGRPQGLKQPPFWVALLEQVQDELRELRTAFRGQDLGLLAVAAAAALGAWKFLPRRPRSAAAAVVVRNGQAPPARLLPAARRFQRTLIHLGIPCPEDRTWSEHLESLPREQLNGRREALAAFVREYNVVRFGGGGEAGPAALDRLRDLLEELDRPGAQ